MVHCRKFHGEHFWFKGWNSYGTYMERHTEKSKKRSKLKNSPWNFVHGPYKCMGSPTKTKEVTIFNINQNPVSPLPISSPFITYLKTYMQKIDAITHCVALELSKHKENRNWLSASFPFNVSASDLVLVTQIWAYESFSPSIETEYFKKVPFGKLNETFDLVRVRTSY